MAYKRVFSIARNPDWQKKSSITRQCWELLIMKENLLKFWTVNWLSYCAGHLCPKKWTWYSYHKYLDLAKSGSSWILGVGCPNPVSVVQYYLRLAFSSSSPLHKMGISFCRCAWSAIVMKWSWSDTQPEFLGVTGPDNHDSHSGCDTELIGCMESNRMESNCTFDTRVVLVVMFIT